MWPSTGTSPPAPATATAQARKPKSALLLEFRDHITLLQDYPDFEANVRACAGLNNSGKITSYVGLADRHEQSSSGNLILDIAKLASQFSTLFETNEVVTAGSPEQLEGLFMFKLGVLLATNDVVVTHSSRPSLSRLLQQVVHEHKPAHFGSLQLLGTAEAVADEPA